MKHAGLVLVQRMQIRLKRYNFMFLLVVTEASKSGQVTVCLIAFSFAIPTKFAKYTRCFVSSQDKIRAALKSFFMKLSGIFS